jgi:hypothetical protein
MVNEIDDHHIILIGLVNHKSDGNVTYSLPTVPISNCSYLAYKKHESVDMLIVQANKLETSLEWLTLDEVCNIRSSREGFNLPNIITEQVLSLAPFIYSKVDLSIVLQPKIGHVECYTSGKLKRREYNEMLGWKVYRKIPEGSRYKIILLFNDENTIFRENFWFVTDDSHIVEWN